MDDFFLSLNSMCFCPTMRHIEAHLWGLQLPWGVLSDSEKRLSPLAPGPYYVQTRDSRNFLPAQFSCFEAISAVAFSGFPQAILLFVSSKDLWPLPGPSSPIGSSDSSALFGSKAHDSSLVLLHILVHLQEVHLSFEIFNESFNLTLNFTTFQLQLFA